MTEAAPHDGVLITRAITQYRSVLGPAATHWNGRAQVVRHVARHARHSHVYVLLWLDEDELLGTYRVYDDGRLKWLKAPPPGVLDAAKTAPPPREPAADHRDSPVPAPRG